MHELNIAAMAALLAAALLLLGVTRELAPAAGLTGRGRWMLAAGLGMGVLAFAFKLLVALLFAVAPAPWTHAALAPAASRSSAAEPWAEAAAVRKVRWRSLPPAAPAPADNPTTPAKVELGRQLFFDQRLSSTGEVACASCHDLLGHAGADGRAVAQGVNGQRGPRNAPTVWNAAFQARQFWDGRAASLEEQALGPITNPIEMGLPSADEAVRRVAADPAYRTAFAHAFGVPADAAAVNATRLAQALAAFERTLVTPDTPYDRFVRGDTGALTPLQLRGLALFEAVGCVQCHGGPNFSAAGIDDGSAPYRAFPAQAGEDLSDLAGLALGADPGRAAAGSRAGVWRVPSLRNVALTAPYFHNGAVATLDEAVRVMARTQLGLAITEAPAVEVVREGAEGAVVQPGRSIGAQDVQALVAFLEALSSPRLAARTVASVQDGTVGAARASAP